ncbi:hypothetical protein KAH27_02680 [bacterium]|nr:hypothetical protein [bacterium]
MKKILFLMIAIIVFPVMAEQSLYNQNYNSASRQKQNVYRGNTVKPSLGQNNLGNQSGSRKNNNNSGLVPNKTKNIQGTGKNFGSGYNRDSHGNLQGTGKNFGRGWNVQ